MFVSAAAPGRPSAPWHRPLCLARTAQPKKTLMTLPLAETHWCSMVGVSFSRSSQQNNHSATEWAITTPCLWGKLSLDSKWFENIWVFFSIKQQKRRPLYTVQGKMGIRPEPWCFVVAMVSWHALAHSISLNSKIINCSSRCSLETGSSPLRTEQQSGLHVPLSDCCLTLPGAAMENNLVSVRWGGAPSGRPVRGWSQDPPHHAARGRRSRHNQCLLLKWTCRVSVASQKCYSINL